VQPASIAIGITVIPPFYHALYPGLYKCVYETINESFQAIFGNKEAVPGMVCGIHTFGRFLNHHPHIHGIFSEGCFDKRGSFYPMPDLSSPLIAEILENLFTHKVLKMLMMPSIFSPCSPATSPTGMSTGSSTMDYACPRRGVFKSPGIED